VRPGHHAAQRALADAGTLGDISDAGTLALGLLHEIAQFGEHELRPTMAVHASSREWLDRMLGRESVDPTVVVTHHGPHPLSVHPRFAGNAVTPAFVSDLSDIIEKHQPPLWLHGHTHDRFDYNVGGTRVVCNPRGYSYENSNGFDPGLVIDVPVPAPVPVPKGL